MDFLLSELPELPEVERVVSHWRAVDPTFSRAVGMGVRLSAALGRLGVQLGLQESWVDSLAVLRAAVALAPDESAHINNLAVMLERADQTPSAIRYVQYSLSLDPAQIDSWIFLGNLRRKRADLAGAAAAYEAAIARETNSPLAWQGLGFVRKDQLRPEEAITCFITCMRQSAPTAPLLSVLGQLYYQAGKFDKARDAYVAAVETDDVSAGYRRMHREMQFICAVIAGEPIDGAMEAYKADAIAHPAPDDKAIGQVLANTFSLLSAYGYLEAAMRVGSKRVELDPHNATAAYLLAAVSGDASIERSPDTYLVEYFDAFSDGFDEQLVKTLGYDIPEKLGFLLAALVSNNARLNVLDAGCGTGLCGPWVRSFSRTLVGVDLSPRMLEQARRRGVYDRLVCDELTAFLSKSAGVFDVIVAADVVIYFGNLTALASALAVALTPGGLLAFSTERATQGNHQLLTSGRFAHLPHYIRAVMDADFEHVHSEPTTVRLEALTLLDGDLFIFRRKPV